MNIEIMDDFEEDFPDFDWKNTPAYKHPGGKNCPCPKHEYIRDHVILQNKLMTLEKMLGSL